MKVAFSVWNKRISPVFDVSRRFMLAHAEKGVFLSQSEETFGSSGTMSKIPLLADLGVGCLVCGAISRPLFVQAETRGIRVHAFIAGELETVMEAYLSGSLSDPKLTMPGCGRDCLCPCRKTT